MWKNIDNKELNFTNLYFEKVMFANNKHNFVFSTDKEGEFLYIIIDGRAHTCRLMDNFHISFYKDKYISKSDIKNVFSKSSIYYTDISEYLDWFRKNSFPDSEKEELYHFYINSEDYTVEFITDEMPDISVIKKENG